MNLDLHQATEISFCPREVLEGLGLGLAEEGGKTVLIGEYLAGRMLENLLTPDKRFLEAFLGQTLDLEQVTMYSREVYGGSGLNLETIISSVKEDQLLSPAALLSLLKPGLHDRCGINSLLFFRIGDEMKIFRIFFPPNDSRGKPYIRKACASEVRKAQRAKIILAK